MPDAPEFQRIAQEALASLRRHLILHEKEDEPGFEVEEQNGVLNVRFEKTGAKLVIARMRPCDRSGSLRSPPAFSSTGMQARDPSWCRDQASGSSRSLIA